MAAGFRYSAFISYSHAERRWANWLHRALETYRIPRRVRGASGAKRIAPVFKDREELATQTSLSDAIENGLAQSSSLLVVCSPAAARSRWVNEEVRRFRQLGRGDRIFCLIVAGDPAAAPGSTGDCFVPALREGPEGREVEPLAADVRPGADGRRAALLKLVAAILALPLDDLRQRDLQRRNQRLVVVTTLSLVGIVGATALATLTLVARADAVRQREIAQREALTANRTTEFLVDLFSVVDPGESRGRSVTAYEILEAGRRNIPLRLADQPQVRDRLLTTMGRVYTGLGLYPTAIELLNAPTASSGSLERLVALGQAQYLAGDYRRADTTFRAAVGEVRTAQHAGMPWQSVYSDALGGLAAVCVELDRLDEAEALLDEALDHDRTGPAGPARDEQVAKTLAGLGQVHLAQGDLARAADRFRAAHTLYVASLGAGHPRTVETLVNLGAVLYLAEDLDGALAQWEGALPAMRTIYGNGHPETASLLNNIGRIYLQKSNLARAQELLGESVAIDRSLGRERHDDLVYSLNSLGMTKAELGQRDAASDLYDQALDLARQTHHRMLGEILMNRADLMCRFRPAPGALEEITHAREAMTVEYGEHSWHLDLLDNVLGGCLAKLGRQDEARDLLARSGRRIEERWGPTSLYGKSAERRLATLAGSPPGAGG